MHEPMVRKRVLVVDDDVEVAVAVGDLLRRSHDVQIALGLREAMECLAETIPDVIVADLEMPPYRGDALLELIAREHPQVRRILYTGASDVVCDTLIKRGIAHVVLLKPCPTEMLLAAVERMGDVTALVEPLSVSTRCK